MIFLCVAKMRLFGSPMLFHRHRLPEHLLLGDSNRHTAVCGAMPQFDLRMGRGRGPMGCTETLPFAAKALASALEAVLFPPWIRHTQASQNLEAQPQQAHANALAPNCMVPS